MSFSKILAASGGNLWEQILHWYQNSVVRELLDYFNNHVFGLEFGVYDNFSVATTTDSTVRNIVIGFLFGMILAAIFSAYNRNVNGKFIRVLLQKEAFSPEKALTLRDCGLFCNPSVRRDLIRGGALAKLTKCVERETLEEADRLTFRPDFMTARFYIPEDLKYRAETRFEQKGFGKLQLALTVVLSFVGAYLFCRFLPSLLTFADWLMTVLAP